MSRTVVGLVGPISSGKQVVVDLLSRWGFSCFSLSDRVREEADRLGQPRSRPVLQDIGDRLRQECGGAILAQMTISLIPADARCVLIDAIRNPAELVFLRENLGAVILGINAPREKRLEWYLERAGRRGEDAATIEAFYMADERDQGRGENHSGQQGRRCLEMADRIIWNDGTRRFLDEIEGLLRDEFHLEAASSRRKEMA